MTIRRAMGVAALAVIIAAVALLATRGPLRTPAPASEPAPTHVGSARCQACHEAEHRAWAGSHHALAMQVAREETVLGDFGGAAFEHRGKTWRFLRRGGRFVVHAEGPDGELADFEVAATFGVEPLQQVLVTFPRGRLQALSAAWDTRRKRWFHVDPAGAAPPGDWLHWTRGGQSWNAMCADCHATAVRKGYDPEADAYRTTWSERGVGCEACHGPGSRHVAWAEAPAPRAPTPDAGLAVRASGRTGRELVALCAPCHARRTQLADQGLPGGELLERFLPPALSPGLFHPDGQVLEEDFEWHAFTQSVMYARGVGCGDCHDVHSGRPRADGNALCTRCHRVDTYDTPLHHRHRPGPAGAPAAGARCVDCHMPGRTFMVIHLRHDHSMRVPRPDLSASLGVPNACSAAGCHGDRPLAWVQARVDAWYGARRRPHYGTALAAGRRQSPGAEAALAELSRDPLAPMVVRASAVELLGRYASEPAVGAVEQALADPEPLVRVTAVRALQLGDPAELARLLGPVLRDPVRTVRAEAAARLAGPPAQELPAELRPTQAAARDEYAASQRYLADLPSGAYNLASLHAAEGRAEEAEQELRRALAIDDRLVLPRVRLARLLAGRGRLEEAERLLREARASEPRDASVALDLGLLLAEAGRREEAEAQLRASLGIDPRLAPAAYNLAVLVGERRPGEAVELARRAATARPDEPRYAFTLAYYQGRAGDHRGAAETLAALIRAHPEHDDAYGLLAEVLARLGRGDEARALLERRPGRRR